MTSLDGIDAILFFTTFVDNNIEFGTKNYPSTSVPIPFVITPEG
jgi:hypothetical protein